MRRRFTLVTVGVALAGALVFAQAPGKSSAKNHGEDGRSTKSTLEIFKTMKSLTIKVNDVAQVHHAGNAAWATAAVDGGLEDGSRLKIDARWTSLWEKRGNDWLIVHEHFSVPMPEALPAKK